MIAIASLVCAGQIMAQERRNQPPSNFKGCFAFEDQKYHGYRSADGTVEIDENGGLKGVFIYALDAPLYSPDVLKVVRKTKTVTVEVRNGVIDAPYIHAQLGWSLRVVSRGPVPLVLRSHDLDFHVQKIVNPGESWTVKVDGLCRDPIPFATYGDRQPTYLLLTPTPFCTVTGSDGTFEFSQLPWGRYTFYAVHPTLGRIRGRSHVTPSEWEDGIHEQGFARGEPVHLGSIIVDPEMLDRFMERSR